jgi:hypothetical protein
MKDCPNCKLVNPDSALRCDCGYDFPSGSMESSYLTARDRRAKAGAGAVGGVVAFLLLLRFAAVATTIGRGFLPTALAIGLLALFVWAVVHWRKYSSRDNSD